MSVITHRIIIEKPKVQVYHSYHPITPIVKNQEELDKYLESCSIKKDMFLTCNWRNSNVYNSSLHGKIGFRYVLDVETNYTKLPYVTDKGHPKCFRLISLFPVGNSHPMLGWEAKVDYHIMTDSEYVQYIEPEYDSVQDYLKLWRSKETQAT